MNLTICLSAAFLILSHAAFCMPIRGQVKAGNKGLSHVVITDGINFTQTDTKGNFLLDTDQEARFVYLLTPDGYVADYQSGTPEFYLPLDPEKEDYIHIEKKWGYFSKSDGEYQEVDFCQDCWREICSSLIIKP